MISQFKKWKNMSDLKNCPFCGKKAKIEETAGNYGYTPDTISVGCPDHKMFTLPVEEYDWDKRKHVSVYEEALAKCKKQWNTRYE